MTPRQSKLLRELIENHMATAEPIASALLAGKVKVSSATVRNELVNLEEEGYIIQPHTSAGRIPTRKGYKYYLDNYLKPKLPSTKQQEKLQQAIKEQQAIKALAKELSEQVNTAVLVAMANNDFYYTGLSNLFAKPEFADQQKVISLSSVLDALDVTLRNLFETINEQVEVLVGEDNPFSEYSGLVITKSRVSKDKVGLLAILGPTRMDYNVNTGLLDYAKITLNQHFS